MIPITDPDTDAPPNHVPLFSTYYDLQLASSRLTEQNNPEEVLRAKATGDNSVKEIDITWWPKDGSRFVDEHGEILQHVAPSEQPEEDGEEDRHYFDPNAPRRQIVFCQPGSAPPELPDHQVACFVSPTSFYETMVSMFAAMRQTRTVPSHMCPRMYEYTPLTSGQNIRILTLWPGSGDTQIRCETREIALGAGEYYEALSYTWGDQSTGTLISFNGLLLPIAPNLCSALLHLRLPDRPRTLWIDAVCINQLDNEEKSMQVQMMREIYQEASKVIVWLGSAQDDSNAAMDMITGDVTAGCEEATVPGDFDFFHDDDLPQSKGKQPVRDTFRQDQHSKSFDPEQLSDDGDTIRGDTEGAESDSERAWGALLALVQRPWWTRAWVLQEYTVPKKEPIFQCGKQVVTGKELQEMCSLPPKAIESISRFLTPETVALKAAFRLNPLFMTREKFQEDGQLDLRRLLRYNLNSQATNLRDKVIALLGLTSQECRDALIPDYSKSITEIFAEAAKYIIQSTGDLNILSINTNSSRETDPPLPSWVPDWGLFATRALTLLQSFVYEASGPYSACIGPSSEPDILEAGGIPIDRVTHVTDIITPESVTSGGLDTLRRTIRALHDELLSAITTSRSTTTTTHTKRPDIDPDRLHPPDSSTPRRRNPRKRRLNPDQFWRTLVADRYMLPDQSFESPAPAAFGQLFDLIFDEHPDTSCIPVDFLPAAPPATRLERFVAPLAAQMGQVLATRRVFVTEGGRTGVGPAEAAVGDVAAVLMGGEMPFLLREVPVEEEGEEGEEGEEEGEGGEEGQGRGPGMVKLVGEAYVHGVMHGEVVEGLPGPGEGLERFMVIFRIC
ncbi:Heterokaryon incompatibility protein [Lasiodiplodia theobromae]|uniref:Heterokaryon incompatibility protein n=1 Tax=Lasiodiplodia theobromae TaxID=45133 RepID=UPI0015C2F726|nr:Heterokaryon incompatibility protein [Lasiodiplodia theobromae]KAF4536067.1 Heterokaryon incompatibility protein [Lasiodiplodia theobromae]